MDRDQSATAQTKAEKSTQTDDPSSASVPVGSSSGANSQDVTNSNEPLADGDADADVEKQHPKEYDENTMLVQWSHSNDPENPRNLSYVRKWIITVMLGLMTVCVTIASSIFSSATKATAMVFKVSPEVMVLGTSLFVLGFAFGPLIFGPFSELYGRKTPLFVGMFVFAIFQIPVAVATNLQTIFICRFFGGLFASAPLAINGGMLADIFDPVDRGIAVAVFAAATFIGPVAGPVVGGFITMSYLGWRWTEYITAIMAFFFSTLGYLIIPETFEPVLLEWRAKKLRHKTKIWGIHAKAEETPANPKNIAEKYLLRPFLMLFLEPILLLITLYMGFIYGFLYLCFMAYPVAFEELRGWNLGVGALPFIAILIGVLAGCLFIIIFTKTRFKSVMEREGHVVPEERLIPMMVGGVLLPGGMFWFAWTSSPHITWVPQVISGGFLGAGILLIFLQGLNYIIDVYSVNANSAIAANSLFRSFLGAGFPLFATPMFHNLGVNWAMSLLGFLTSVLFPVPILFYIYGKKIRAWSKYTVR